MDTKTTTVLITGAASGMGRLATERALARGQQVLAWDVDETALASLPQTPGLHRARVDVRDHAAVAAAVEQAEAELGPIDEAWHAAAIMPLGLALEQSAELQRRIMDINYGGLVNLAQTVGRRMQARDRGTLVSFASLAGWIPAIYISAYNASKFACVAYTEVLAHELRDSGVHVVCVCPPMVATPLLDQARDTVWPKLFDLWPPLEPAKVLDAVDRAIAKRRLWVFPGPLTRISLWLRRWLPGFSWWIAHRVEGR